MAEHIHPEGNSGITGIAELAGYRAKDSGVVYMPGDFKSPCIY